MPRNKSCGGMLHELSQDFLAPFGKLPREMILEPEHVHFRYHDWDRDIKKPTDVRFVNVDRRMFDEWLLSVLPPEVEVVGSCPLTSLELSETDVVCRFKTGGGEVKVGCSHVIGADGARSAVRRAIGLGSTATYVTLQDFVELRSPIEPYFDCIYMRDIGDEYGYGYIVPKGPVAIVGSVFYPKTKRPHEKHQQVLDAIRERMPQIGDSVRREACAALSVRSRHDIVPGAGNVLLAGEAGGFMSPTSGEGISYALRTGALAGQAIAENSHALERYRTLTSGIAFDIKRRLLFLPVMESSLGKWVGGFVPTPIISRMTRNL